MYQVKVNNRSLHELDLTKFDDDYESPFSCVDYYEPELFSEKTNIDITPLLTFI